MIDNELNELVMRIDSAASSDELANIAFDLVSEVRRLRAELAKHKPTVREGWALGDAPVCKSCGATRVAEAYLDEGWLLQWACPDCGHLGLTNNEEDELMIDWPFEPEESRVMREDLEELGFTYVD